jgi:hypothetical protein
MALNTKLPNQTVTTAIVTSATSVTQTDDVIVEKLLQLILWMH